MATILVVDEGPINRHFVVTLLRDHGHRALEASSGDEVLNLIRNEHPDLVLIDILMPDIDVRRFLLDMREERDLIQPRFVFRAPACIEAQGRALARALGASFLAKPDSPDVLLAAVDEALAQPQLQSDGAHPEPTAIESVWRAAVEGSASRRRSWKSSMTNWNGARRKALRKLKPQGPRWTRKSRNVCGRSRS
jgi:CheY-like chemotaxis protein